MRSFCVDTLYHPVVISKFHFLIALFGSSIAFSRLLLHQSDGRCQRSIDSP